MKYLLYLSLFSLAAHAQFQPDRYIVELSTPPAARVAREGRPAQRARIAVEQQRVRQSLERAGVRVIDQFQTVHNSLAVRMSGAEAERVRGLAGVKRVTPMRIFHPSLDHSLPLQKFPDAWAAAGGLSAAGKGIKIAIIDTGVDASHPAFADGGAKPPAGFPKVNDDADKAYTNGKVIVARSYANPDSGRTFPAKDIDGHGTGVAMIAAGGAWNGPYGLINGGAPAAWIGSYKVFPDDSNGGAYDAVIIRAIEDAVNDGMDVLNISLGGLPALAVDQDAVVAAVENASAMGRVVTISAGNDGPALNTVTSPGSAPSAVTVGNSKNNRVFAGRVITDGRDPYALYPGDGRNRTVTAEIADVTPADSTGLACSSLPSGTFTGKIVLVLRGVCNFEDKVNNAMDGGAMAVVIYSDATRPDAVEPSVGAAFLPAGMISYNDGIDLKSRLAQGTVQGTLNFGIVPVSVSATGLSAQTSRGPNVNMGVKPDLVAVGTNIYTAAPVVYGSYIVEDGTSFAAPAVAGAAALLMAQRPGLTSAQYRSLLVNSTTLSSTDGVTPLPAMSAGSGLLNASAALAGTVTANPVSLSFGRSSGTVDVTKTFTLTNTGKAADTFAISAIASGSGPVPVVTPNSVQLAPGQSADVQVQLAGNGLTPGEVQGYLLVQGTQSTVAARVAYWHGVASEVPADVQLLGYAPVADRGAVVTLFFRFIDSIGLPVYQRVDSSVVSGVKVVNFGSADAQVPGAFRVDVKMPDDIGVATIHLELLGVSTDVLIAVR